jgi:hypothetical protein
MTAFHQWYEQFAKTGDVQPVRFGMSRAELREMFGEPGATGGTSKKYREPAIWVYDGLEFHFHHDELCLVFKDSPAGVIHSLRKE